MPITLPNLDDRAYADLVEEARALIPAYESGWTNFNPSDPGITLVELFAYLTEMLLYRLDRVTEANVRAFLKLLNEPDWKPKPDEPLSKTVGDTVRLLREPYRAVTCGDFEFLTLKAANAYRESLKDSDRQMVASLSAFELPPIEAAGGVTALTLEDWEVRALCVPERNLEAADEDAREEVSPGHMSVVLMTRTSLGGGQPTNPGLVGFVNGYLGERRLVTTHVHVVMPHPFEITIRFTLVLTPDALAFDAEKYVREPAEAALRAFLDPVHGGADGAGWPFGRSVYVSELYELLDGIHGVDYVTRSTDERTSRPLDELAAPEGEENRLRRNAGGDVVAVALRVDEVIEPLVKLSIMFPSTE